LDLLADLGGPGVPGAWRAAVCGAVVSEPTRFQGMSRDLLIRWIQDGERDLRLLNDNLTAVQTRCTALLEESRSLRRERLRDMVAEFHARFDFVDRETPGVPDEATVRFRLRLMAEEFFETIEAAVLIDPVALDITRNAIVRSPVHVDLPAFADGLTDLLYVIVGTLLAFGIDGGPIARLVHEANCKKGPAGVSGKPTKPDGWKPPDVEGELVRQGWRR
jgi:predicted HAD superfamily Cof-like phosphohydrolase